MMGQTDGRTKDHVIGSALYTIRAVSIIEEKPVETISTIFILHTSSCQYTSRDVTTLYPPYSPYVTHRHTSLDPSSLLRV